MSHRKDSLAILHLVLSIGATSSPYNEHCLPWADDLDISICTFFKPDITPQKNISLITGDGSVIGFLRTLKRVLWENSYDVIHAHSPHVGFLLLCVKILFLHRTAPTIITVHDSYPNFKLRNRLLLLPIFAAFTKIVCCSRASQASFPTIYKGLAGNRLIFIQNGLDITRVDRSIAHSQKSEQNSDDFTVVAISRLVAIKNPLVILAAFINSAVPNGRLIYIGTGTLHAKLQVQKKRIDPYNKIQFTGLISREKVFEYLMNADLFISASRGEGLPVSVLEAMASRCPVLLSDIPPHREIAEHGDFIPLIDPDDIQGFSREIKRFSQMSCTERRVIGEQCRRVVENQFSLQKMHTEYMQIYSQVVGRETAVILETNL